MLGAFAAGYILGARAGRDRYETIKRAFLRVKNNPSVQQQTHRVADAARGQAPVVMHKVADAASAAAHKVKGDGHPGSGPDWGLDSGPTHV